MGERWWSRMEHFGRCVLHMVGLHNTGAWTTSSSRGPFGDVEVSHPNIELRQPFNRLLHIQHPDFGSNRLKKFILSRLSRS